MNQEILTKLKILKETLKKEFKFFPSKTFREASDRAAKLGLDKTYGLFIDDNGIGNDHDWNKKDGRIYDITAKQFSKNLPEIYVVNEDSEEAKSRYIEGVYLMI